MKFAATVSCGLLVTVLHLVEGVAAASHRHHSHRNPKAHAKVPAPQAHAKVPVPVAEANQPAAASALPAVSTLLDPASETLRSLNAKASILEAQTNIQLSRERETFSARLTALTLQNKMLTSDIQELTSKTDVLRKHANQLTTANQLMRTELRAAKSSLTNARDFSSKALKNSDDSHAQDLDVLQPAGKKVSFVAVGVKDQGYDDQESDQADDQGDDDDDSENDDQGASLLALSSRIRRRAWAAATVGEGAEAAAASQMSDIEALEIGRNGGLQGVPLLEVLSKNIADLAKQQRQSEQLLRGAYDTKLNALLKQQKSLNTTKASLLTLRAKLTAAEAHLERTNLQLQKQLRGLGLFLQKLTHMILAPASEVGNQLRKLPKDVAALLPAGSVPRAQVKSPKAQVKSPASPPAQAKKMQSPTLQAVQID
mmetsp:Transcript_132935/g.258822  ORF Transcript_132935/g.258822 Transcript_132935/m.258822 type:complete len:427 (-) Transcript_132935:187-1467(-)